MASKVIEFSVMSGLGNGLPPIPNFVIIYFLQKRQTVAEANCFLKCYQSQNWKNVKGKKVKNWKTAANEWIWQKKHPNCKRIPLTK